VRDKKNSGKAPSFQFYWKDWLSDTRLLRCSRSAKGAWIDIICLSCDMPVPGVFCEKIAEKISKKTQKISKNLVFSEQKIVQMLHGKRAENNRGFAELKSKGIIKQFADGEYAGAFYVKRVYKDALIRKARSDAGKQGGNPEFQEGKPNPYYKQDDKQKDKQKDKQRDKQRDKQKIDTSSSSSSSTANRGKGTGDKEENLIGDKVTGVKKRKVVRGPQLVADVLKNISPMPAKDSIPDPHNGKFPNADSVYAAMRTFFGQYPNIRWPKDPTTRKHCQDVQAGGYSRDEIARAFEMLREKYATDSGRIRMSGKFFSPGFEIKDKLDFLRK